jgi:UDPglucose--hexose-1-phosphate uridylyltransferase
MLRFINNLYMDFKFIEDESKDWVISAPKRQKRPTITKGTEPVCPFCVGSEGTREELYRIGSSTNVQEWRVRVVPNHYPFAPIHEIVIHSPDHHKSFDELPLIQTQAILNTFKNRFNEHKDKGSVYIFTNHGEEAGESLPHPHSQLVVIPDHVKLNLPKHDISTQDKTKETQAFTIFSPFAGKWPDEVWIYPKERNRFFGDITQEEIVDLSKVLYRLLQIFDLRHGHEFPYNLCFYPYKDWYLRMVPRLKVVGGFEIGTEVFVNTQDPSETMDFILEHFDSPDEEKIKTVHRATYRRKA